MASEGWWWFVGRIFDLVALFLAFLPLILLSGRGAQPFQRGFFCDDGTIRYPYRPDTVSLEALFMGTLFISTGIILLVELDLYFNSTCFLNVPPLYRFTSKCSTPNIVYVLYRVLGSLYFGFAVTLSLIDIGKYSLGKLEPNFLDVCRPDPTSYNCTSPETGRNVFVENFSCIGTNTHRISSSRTSFPSRHAGLSAYFAAFLLIYLQVRLTWKPIRMLRHVLQAACYAAVIYICLTRVTDNAHYWSDVVAGIILGTVIGILVVFFVCRILRLESDLAEAEKPIQQEAAVVEVVEDPTPITAIHAPRFADAPFPVYDTRPNLLRGNAWGDNKCGIRCNSGGYASMLSPVQQQCGVYPSIVHFK